MDSVDLFIKANLHGRVFENISEAGPKISHILAEFRQSRRVDSSTRQGSGFASKVRGR